MLPPREQWSQYKKGNVTENDIVNWSINQFTNHRENLAAPYAEDFFQERINAILQDIAREMEEEARMKKMSLKPKTSEEFLVS